MFISMVVSTLKKAITIVALLMTSWVGSPPEVTLIRGEPWGGG